MSNKLIYLNDLNTFNNFVSNEILNKLTSYYQKLNDQLFFRWFNIFKSRI